MVLQKKAKWWNKFMETPTLTSGVNAINTSGIIRVGEAGTGYRPEDFAFRRDEESLSFHRSAFSSVFGEKTACIAGRLWMNSSPSQADLEEFEKRTGIGWNKFMEMAKKTSNREPLKVVDINRT